MDCSVKFHGPEMYACRVECRPVINKPLPFKGLNIRIPIVIPTEGRGLFIRGRV